MKLAVALGDNAIVSHLRRLLAQYILERQRWNISNVNTWDFISFDFVKRVYTIYRC